MSFDGKFYLGRALQKDSGEVSSEPILYDPDDLTTHAVVVGMTGSGKTGLCLDLLDIILNPLDLILDLLIASFSSFASFASFSMRTTTIVLILANFIHDLSCLVFAQCPYDAVDRKVFVF